MARYPDPLIRRWLAYVQSDKGDNLRNKAGFIRANLKESEVQRQTPRPGGSPEKPGNAGSEFAEAQRIWSVCLEELARQLSPEEYGANLEGTRAVELREGILPLP